MKVLVIDVGGSNAKLRLSEGKKRTKFETGPAFTPEQLISESLKATSDWDYDAISIGFPAPVLFGKITHEPNNLAKGWVKFDFEKAFKKPVKIINDAAMQAIGSYEGKRMLFVGLGTGLGSALIVDYAVIPIELGELQYSEKLTIEDVLGKRGRKRLTEVKWEQTVHKIVERWRIAFVVDYVVIGGGNAKRLKKFPAGSRRGENSNAFAGGERLWDKTSTRGGGKRAFTVL
ncbi:MAG: ROK family protein [Verrucomicrobiota bacterium]|nr:ROK family protein [Verrucomicrobiota bacterium]